MSAGAGSEQYDIPPMEPNGVSINVGDLMMAALQERIDELPSVSLTQLVNTGILTPTAARILCKCPSDIPARPAAR